MLAESCQQAARKLRESCQQAEQSCDVIPTRTQSHPIFYSMPARGDSVEIFLEDAISVPIFQRAYYTIH